MAKFFGLSSLKTSCYTRPKKGKFEIAQWKIMAKKIGFFSDVWADVEPQSPANAALHSNQRRPVAWLGRKGQIRLQIVRIFVQKVC